MNEHVTDLLSPLIDGALGRGERERIQRHLDSCDSCRARENELREVVGRVRALPVASMPQPVHIPHLPPPTRLQRWWRERRGLLAGGAGMVVAAATAVVLLHGSASPAPTTALTTTPRAAATAPHPATAPAVPSEVFGANPVIPRQNLGAGGEAGCTAMPANAVSLAPPAGDAAVSRTATMVVAAPSRQVSPGERVTLYARTIQPTPGEPCVSAAFSSPTAASSAGSYDMMLPSGSSQQPLVTLLVPRSAIPGDVITVTATSGSTRSQLILTVE